MSGHPAASVIIPVLNGAATLNDLLVALKAQAGVPGPFEIIVVDNGSTDRTVEIARSHGVQVLHQPVRGPSAARNLGLARAQSYIVFFTDADTVPSRRWMALMLAAFADPEVILATSPIHGWQPSTGSERFSCAHKGYTRELSANHPIHPFAHGMNIAVRRQAALDIGGWDATMSSGEDMDFCIRLRKRFGKAIHFVDQAVLFHRHRSTDEALWKQARWHGAGYALLHQRHPDLLMWPVWRSGCVYASLAVLHLTSPLVALGCALRLFSPERAGFERYHRQWTRHFWAGFFEQRRKPAT
jgi:glycosyltransferase involved in cell wall biosynthesis